MNPTAVIYARVSTDEQAKGYSLATQIEACKRFAAERGYKIIQTFSDDYSGASIDRPGLNQLREFITNRNVGSVIVYDIDRIARKSVYQMLIEEDFRRVGTRVDYVLGQYDDTDEGRLQKQIRASIAEYEKAKIMERSKRGKRGKAKSGYVLVGARPPYGYQVESEPHKAWLKIDEEEAKIVRLVFQWYLDGDGSSGPISMLSIAARLTEMGILTRGDKETHVAKKRGKGVWSGAMIRHILNNETYIGNWHYGKTKIVNDGKESLQKAKPKRGLGKQVARPREEWVVVPVPPIIDPADFERTKERMRTNIEQSKRNVRHKYLMGRRLHCNACGYTYVGRTRREKHKYYYCKGKEQKPVSLCDMPNFRADIVDNVVWGWVRSLLEDPERFSEGLRGVQAEKRKANQALFDRFDILKSQLDEAEQQRERLLDLYVSGEFPREMLTERKNHLESLTANLRKEFTELSAHIQKITYSEGDLATIEDYCTQIRKKLETATFEGKRRVLELLDVHGRLAIEDEERVIYVTCLISPQPVSLVLTSPS